MQAELDNERNRSKGFEVEIGVARNEKQTLEDAFEEFKVRSLDV